MEYPFVSIIILNWNRGHETISCLKSIGKLSYPNYNIQIVDSGSTDDSILLIKSQYPKIPVLEIGANLGYAGGNNIGIQSALNQGADWVFLLNDDALVDPDCLSILVDAGKKNPMVGILGPTVYHYDEPTTIQSAGGKLNAWWVPVHNAQNEKDDGQIQEPQRVDWLSGCAILLKREALQQVGLLDERFYLYWEETEWCLRARKKGWEALHIPGAKIWHKGVQQNYRPSPIVTYYDTRNRFLFFAKQKAPLQVWLIAAFQTIRTLISWTIQPKWRSMREHRDAMWQGALDFLYHRWGPKSY